MSERPLAVLVEAIHAAADGPLREAGFDVERLDRSPDASQLAALLARATVIGLRSKTRLPATSLSAAQRLAAVGCFCIGTDQVDLACAARTGVPVFNSPFSNTRSVAELTLAEIIALSRRLFDKSAQLHTGLWDKSAKESREVRGRTLGIVGYGHIGSQLSVLAEGLGMRVVYFDIARRLALGNAHALPSLQAVLEASDVVSLHVPDTDRTRNLIGAKELAQMKRGAALINNSRGKVVDLEALAAALRSGHLSGAAADVFPEEPAENGQGFRTPLAGLGNVILTPHIGGSTEEAQEAIAVDVAEKLARFWKHGTTATAVNFPQVDLPQVKDGLLRILHVHRNVPGVLGKMHTLLAQAGINIHAEFLQSDSDTSFVILDVDPFGDATLIDGLGAMPETIRMRIAR
ncbi:MAG: phosphoglycerate dehydrogenase [Planctomycetaceae bacterium]|nr:phosphoglycerate dehydrogenase [Planctomycetaceae bacterium]